MMNDDNDWIDLLIIFVTCLALGAGTLALLVL